MISYCALGVKLLSKCRFHFKMLRGSSLNDLESGINNGSWKTAALIKKASYYYYIWKKRVLYDLYQGAVMLLSFSLSMKVLFMRAITDNLFSILNFALLLCRSAHLLSRYRPRCPIIAVTRSPQVHSAL